jgi:hypothetical protein
MPDRLADIKNVRDFGAKGDNSTDDSDAIQSAVNWTNSPDRGVIFFPPGRYRLSKSITFNAANINIQFRGVGDASLLVGDIPGYLLDRTVGNGERGGVVIDGFKIMNGRPGGGGVRISKHQAGSIENCQFYADRSINLTDNIFSISVRNCDIRGINPNTSIGILTQGAGTIDTCDIVGCLHGIRAAASVCVTTCRLESNVVGIMIGMNQSGGRHACTAVVLGTGFEANDTGIYAYHMNNATISSVSIQGQSYAPQPGGGTGNSHYGIRFDQGENNLISALTAGWPFVVGGVVYDGALPLRSVMLCVSSSKWVLPSSLAGLTRLQCS